MKVLIVDDDPVNIDIIEEYLAESGESYETVSASNGKEALEVLKKVKVDIILLDRMMPNMNGMEFMNIVSKDAKLKNIPVVMQTAATSANEVLEGAKTGVCYYLAKPFERELLLSIIKSVTEKARQKSYKKVYTK